MKKFLLMLLALMLASAMLFAFTACGESDDEGDQGNDEEQHQCAAAETKSENTVDATCTAAGSYDEVTYCSCGKELSRTAKTVDALGHDAVAHDAKAATCTEKGWAAYEACSRCDYTTKVEKAALGHKATSYPGKAATCTESGWDVYIVCSVCNYSTYQEKAALGHNRQLTAAKAPTCSNAGWEEYTACTRCGDGSETRVEIDALGHDVVAHEAVEPTCLTVGWDAYETCSRCDELNTYVEKAALRHDLELHVSKAPTCTEIGWSQYQTCSRCEYSTYVEKAALGHKAGESGTENYVDSGCETYGSFDEVVYCSACNGGVYSRETVSIEPKGHRYVDNEAQAPTCTKIGWDAYQTCRDCDYTTYAQIDALGHTHGEIVVENNVDPRCEETGSYDNVTYCTVCSEESSRETITVAALGHTHSEVAVENYVAAICERAGSYDDVVTCTVCDKELSRETKTIPALEHVTQELAERAPTCIGQGFKGGIYCTVCEKVLEAAETTPALGHTDGEAVVENNVDPDCVNAGSHDRVIYCSVCDAELSRETITADALGHTALAAVVENEVAPTCTEKGSHDEVVYCETCEAELSRVPVIEGELGHDPVEHAATKATCSAAGHTAYETCERCDYESGYYEIPVAYHSYNLENPYVCEHCGEDLPASEGLDFIEVDGGYSVAGIGDCFDDVIVIPYEYNGQPVVAIEPAAFMDCFFTSVIIPGSVKTIGDEAFAFNFCLENVVMLEGVEEIGAAAFMLCDMLTSVTIANTVTYIGESAFDSCPSLECIVIPASVETMGYGIFALSFENLVIICEAAEQPEGWNAAWNDGFTVIWVG